MKFRQQVIFWLAAALFIGLFVWAFNEILLPFVAGITIAYLLNPILVRLAKFKLSRTVATVLILSLFFIVLIALLGLLIPPIYQEILQLADRAPEYVDSLWARLQPYLAIVEERVNENDLDQSLRDALKGNISNALGAGTELLGGILSGGRTLVKFGTFVVVTPLVAFFMMIEWQSIVSWVDDQLPRHSYDQVRTLLGRIDKKIAGFIRGQLLVALSLGVLYAFALSIAGLQFGFIIGITAGLLSVIPLFGSAVGLVVSVGVAYLQSPDIGFILTIAGIFLIGQLLEGNVIAPKLMGQSVGLHPLWILFALMAGGSLFGIVGMVLAVPVAASVGVLISFMLERYKESSYYE
tara:strand:- start:314 stop:1366 length:1053 start_codon:yes stop_codon:yes gene_type:complete